MTTLWWSGCLRTKIQPWYINGPLLLTTTLNIFHPLFFLNYDDFWCWRKQQRTHQVIKLHKYDWLLMSFKIRNVKFYWKQLYKIKLRIRVCLMFDPGISYVFIKINNWFMWENHSIKITIKWNFPVVWHNQDNGLYM